MIIFIIDIHIPLPREKYVRTLTFYKSNWLKYPQ